MHGPGRIAILELHPLSPLGRYQRGRWSGAAACGWVACTDLDVAEADAEPGKPSGGGDRHHAGSSGRAGRAANGVMTSTPRRPTCQAYQAIGQVLEP